MSTEKFKQFEQAFEEHEVYEGNIYELIEATEDWNSNVVPFGGKLVQDIDEEIYDSYGYENSTLGRVFYFEEFDINVLFYGTRSSYNGTEWDGYREVKETTQIIKKWE